MAWSVKNYCRRSLLEARWLKTRGGNLPGIFVETDQWRRISNDEIDIIRGAGKSAIYALLNEKEAEFFDKRILITAGEHPRGETVFRDIITDPPASEAEFILLWKLYILSLVAREMRRYDIRGDQINLGF